MKDILFPNPKIEQKSNNEFKDHLHYNIIIKTKKSKKKSCMKHKMKLGRRSNKNITYAAMYFSHQINLYSQKHTHYIAGFVSIQVKVFLCSTCLVFRKQFYNFFLC
jgi:hypothetical protein